MARTKAQRRAAKRVRRQKETQVAKAKTGGASAVKAKAAAPLTLEDVAARIEADLAALPRRPWFVVQTWAGYERAVEDGLKEAGFQAYLPREIVKGHRRGMLGSVAIKRPLIYGYVFVVVDRDAGQRFDQARDVVGVSRFVTPAGCETPARMPARDVERLRLSEEAGLFDRTSHLGRTVRLQGLEAGATVKVAVGPFTGWLATVLRAKPGEARVRVLLSIFGRGSEIDFGVDEVERVEEKAKAA